MRNPFSNLGRGKPRNRLLDLDSWIDDTLFKLFSSSGDRWENVVIFFRRFRVTGFRKFMVEILDEGVTIGTGGAIVMLALALPAFD